jgi:LCP family protein required for cell wall assembly
MVPLSRRGALRRGGLRPGGAAAVTTPLRREGLDGAAGAPGPAGPAGAPGAAGADLPTLRVAAPERGAAAFDQPTDRVDTGTPTRRAQATATTVAPPQAPQPAGPPPAAARPAASQTADAAPRTVVASTAPPSPVEHPDEEPEGGAPAPGAGAAPPGPPAPTRATASRTPDPAWAATSAVLAGVGQRFSAWWGHWTWRRTLRLATAGLAVTVVLVCGLAWGASSWVQAAIRQIGALDPDSAAIQDAAAQQGDQNFLIVGSDTRVGAVPSEEVGSSSDIPGARSDTVMVVHVPQDRSRVTVVSFPRDLEISRPDCERWDSVTGAYTGQQIPRTQKVKLNTAYQAGGPRCVTKVVQELSGLAINHFLGIDFQGFKDMVDAVQGVPVCVERPVRDTVLGPVIERPGTSLLTGDQALAFVRARHVVGDPTSDYGRIQRQQRFLAALLRTTLSAGTLLDVGKLRGLVDAVSRSTFGEEVGTDELLALGRSLGSLDPGSVTFTSVPTTGVANSRGNEVLRASDDRALFSSIIEGRALPGQAPAPGAPPAVPPPAPVPPELVTVRVTGPASGSTGNSGSEDGDEPEDGEGSSDGSSSGSVASVASSLRSYGFGVVTDDASGSGSSTDPGGTVIRFSPDQAGAAATLARSLPGAVTEPEASGAGLLALSLGDDFDGRVVSPTAAAVPAGPVAPVISAADTTCQ